MFYFTCQRLLNLIIVGINIKNSLLWENDSEIKYNYSPKYYICYDCENDNLNLFLLSYICVSFIGVCVCILLHLLCEIQPSLLRLSFLHFFLCLPLVSPSADSYYVDYLIFVYPTVILYAHHIFIPIVFSPAQILWFLYHPVFCSAYCVHSFMNANIVTPTK